MSVLKLLRGPARAALRRRAALAVALCAAAGAVVAVRWQGSVERTGGLAVGEAFADSLLARTAAAEVPRNVAFGDAVALGYLERLRLGLGSPFRLAEYALRDPRVDTTARRHLAWAIVGRTLRGQAYSIDPAALAGVTPAPRADSSRATVTRGARHLALIEGAIAGDRDPRAGELAVRLAYELAVAERTVQRNALALVAPVAALVRDRHAARSDARRLLREARAAGSDPLATLVVWRRERRLAVERPAAEPIGEAVEAAAMARVAVLLDSIRAITRGPSPDVEAVTAEDERSPTATSILPAAAAERLALGVAGYSPPQTPVVTAVRHHGATLLVGSDTGARADRGAVFVERATNEESFAAEAARLAARERDAAPLARTAVAAAAALRAYAQESPWFPGDAAPSEDELRREFGVASVRFDGDVPSRWRPYYRRMLADGLRDLRRVFPAVALDGAHVRFRSGALGGATLAMHHPGTRTIHLPIATSAGALAHEVAHDLDWQLGRRRYGRRGSYGTDVVVREQRGRLAASLRGLTSARLIPPAEANSGRPPDDVRPAEVFARTLDWFVAMALAREGRVNGYLTAVQDEVLTGHVAVLPRDVGGWSAPALADVLEETTLVGAPLREWLLSEWGPAARARRPFTLVREIVAAPVMRRGEITARLGASGPAPSGCVGVPTDGVARSRAALAYLAAEARARGALLARAQRYAETTRAPWAASLLGDGPWAPALGEDAVRRVAAGILTRLEEVGAIGAALDWSEQSFVDRAAADVDPGAGCLLRIY